MAVKTKGKPSETPLMKQYLSIKARYPDAILLFRVGDFYETFGDDAIKASNILGIVLTKRQNGAAATVELAGFPHHSLDTYLPKLVRAGQRVAICDQLEDPKLTKSIVKRGVTELVTPGVSFNDNVLEHKSNNFLAALHFEKDQVGVAFLDVSTGEFLTAQGNEAYIDKLLQSFCPSEVLFERKQQKKFEEIYGNKFCTFKLEDWVFTQDFSKEILLNHFGTKTLKGFGVEQLHLGVIASGAALHYLRETQHDRVSHITALARIEEEKYMWLDRFTIRNLELISSGNPGAKTLLDVLDRTISPMGARLLKRWIVLPLKDKKPIEERLNVVDFFVNNQPAAGEISDEVSKVGDLERIISKVAVFKIGPREIIQLKRALKAVSPIQKLCKESGNPSLTQIGEKLDACESLIGKIEATLQQDVPAVLAKGNVIANGINAELDELRNISLNAKEFLNKIQKRETERTGISSLKIAFNNVFGYYIEVRNTHKDKVPADWIRKQTLVSAERYITEELKEFEGKILGAEAKIAVLEVQLYQELVQWMQGFVPAVQANAGLLAHLDVLLSFSKTALENNYKKPEILESDVLEIKDGRHPVIEQQLPVGEVYVANDIYLDSEKQQIIMITGPNMAGKSALLRQTALIVLMAQMGAFVPATYAKIGLIDKIFTRVGASDNISSGESTFMVEMNETASILNNISHNSLILLDEIGRGTSTYDGISIAWAIAEFLHDHNRCKPKTLFATHYHELNEMCHSFDRIKNYNVSVREVNNKVIFMRKLVSGGSEHSFGIHVAKMAGMPKKVVNRANKIMGQLENSHAVEDLGMKTKKIKKEDLQFQLFEIADPVLNKIREEIASTDVNTLTPIEALMKLNEIKNLIQQS